MHHVYINRLLYLDLDQYCVTCLKVSYSSKWMGRRGHR